MQTNPLDTFLAISWRNFWNYGAWLGSLNIFFYFFFIENLNVICYPDLALFRTLWSPCVPNFFFPIFGNLAVMYYIGDEVLEKSFSNPAVSKMQEHPQNFDTCLWTNDTKELFLSCRSSSWKYSDQPRFSGKRISNTFYLSILLLSS